MITREDCRLLGFKTRFEKNNLRRLVKREWIPRKHIVMTLDNGMTLLIRGHKLFYIDNYDWLMDCYRHGSKQQFFEYLWKKPSLDISKVSIEDMKRIVKVAKDPATYHDVKVQMNVTYANEVKASQIAEQAIIDLRGSRMSPEMIINGVDQMEALKWPQTVVNSTFEDQAGDQEQCGQTKGIDQGIRDRAEKE